MTRAHLLLMLALPITPLAAQADPDKAVAGGGELPAGWQARTDRGQALTNVKFGPMGNGLHATLGPAAIFWRAEDQASGGYHAIATFTQARAPGHPEAYRLLGAGNDLTTDGQRYVYILVRGDGQYLIKRRAGAQTTNISAGWTKHDAVKPAGADGKATNTIEVTVRGGKAEFAINGTVVHSMDATDMAGVAGLRVNHNLDVHIDGFGLHQLP